MGLVMHHVRLGAALVAACIAFCASGIARGEPSPRGVPSVFFIAKSENKNQVHYGVHVDAQCVPAGAAPVFAYWRMLERGPQATEPLLDREVPAYGVAEQRVIERRADGGRVVLRLRALADRIIEIDTSSSPEGGCLATATTYIGGVPAVLSSVFAQLRWPFGVDHLLITGRAIDGGRALRERVSG
jgi:hypothetical protein